MKPLVRQFLCAVLAGVFCCIPLLSHATEVELRVITLKHRLANVNFQELVTQLLVRPGEWLDLGSTVGSVNEVNRQILGTRRFAASEDSRFLIRVKPQ